MVALIQDEVTVNHAWLSTQEFADILAVSQATPGPIGINTATYTGYTAVVNAGCAEWMGVLGALLASLAVIALPVMLMLLAVRAMRHFKDNPIVAQMLRMLRMAAVGLIAAAALQLVNAECFGVVGLNLRFILSIAIFAAAFVLSLRRVSPIWLMLGAGLIGVIVY